MHLPPSAAALLLVGLVASCCGGQEVVPSVPPLTLEAAESFALESHPQVAEAAERVRAARGNWVQVGLPPNPTVGYAASEIGSDGSAGQQGMYVGQQFIRGNKLGLNQQVAEQEIRKLEQRLTAERLRVQTAVRIAYYDAYIAGREVEVTQQLSNVSQQATQSVAQLLSIKEAPRIDLLQSEIEQQRIGAKLRQATARRDASWRSLAVAMNQPDMAPRPLEADPSQLGWPYDWETSREMLLDSSPELAALMFEVRKARAALMRACAEPVPDVSAQVAVQYDTAQDDTLASVQVGIPLPVWNRNQGGIAQARGELAAAQHRLAAKELELTGQLAERLRQLESAAALADAFRQGILGRAEENLELTRLSYEASEASYLEFLTVQRTYFESNLDYLAALREVNRSVQLLTNYLLDNRSN